MLKNHFTIAFRNLRKNKKLSFINIFGLAIGITCSLLIFLFVLDELSYDSFHSESERIHRVVKDFDFNNDGNRIPDATSQGPLAPAIQEEIPEIVYATTVSPDWGQQNLVKFEEHVFNERGVWRVDDNFFNVFTFPFIQGHAENVFKDVNSIVLTEQAAKKYFGDEVALGKTINIDDKEVMVSGVIQDVPANSHFHFNFLLPLSTLPENMLQSWTSYNFYTYIKVQEETDIITLNTKIQDVYERNQETRYSTFYTQPLRDIHLKSRLKWELKPNGDILYVYVFSLIGFFILLIAAINYINLSTAKSSLRAKEVGVRKVSGADRISLIRQFLLESVIVCLLATAVGLLLGWLLLPWVNELTQKELSILDNHLVMISLLIGALVLGVIAGIFPALYLSSFKPITVLKGLKLNENSTLGLRKVLVVVQFTISIVLIVGALIISQQMSFIQSAKLGFEKDKVLVVKNANKIPLADRNVLLNNIKGLPGIKNASTSLNVLGEEFSTTTLKSRGSDNEGQLNYTAVGYDFFDVLEMDIIEGRQFSEDFPADMITYANPEKALERTIGSVILNEVAAKELGLEKPFVGNQIYWGAKGDTTFYLDIVGITENFHFTSLRNEIKPFGFIMARNWASNYMIKLSTTDISNTLQQLENLWVSISPELPFEYAFMDDTFSRLYASETRFQKVFIFLVLLGILISCLGLFGLATFAAENRRKEIGIRKVLGASVISVIGLLSKDFLKLVLVALVFAVPLAWLAMDRWLEDFAYRIEIKWWVFVVAAGLALIIAFLTISSQALKSALSNPVQNIRTD